MRIGICGLGVMGKNHLRVANKLGLEIKAVYDPVLENNSYENFLEECKFLDGAIIATPTKTHLKIIKDIFSVNNKIKILCEKPIHTSSNLENYEQIINFNEQILVGQIERFNPIIVKLETILKNEKIVQLKTFRVNNVPARETIDVRKDIGIHDLDVSLWLLNNNKINNFKINSYGKKGSFDHEVLTYLCGDAFVCNEISWKYPFKLRTIEILTENGLFKGNYFSQELFFYSIAGLEEKIEINKEEPLVNEIKFFCEMIENKVTPKTNIKKNLELLKLLGY